MMDKIVRSPKNYELAAAHLQEDIRQGRLKPGDRLDSVEQLSRNFQMSRSAVREALSALRALGFIEIRQGEGTFVKEPQPEDPRDGNSVTSGKLPENRREIAEFFEVRKILESGTSALAAARRTEEQLEAIRQALSDMREAGGDEAAAEAADIAFHLAVARAAQNGMLEQMMIRMSDTLVRTMRDSRRMWLYAEQATVDRLYQEHDLICQAIAEKNESLAQQLMIAHLMKVEKALLQLIQP